MNGIKQADADATHANILKVTLGVNQTPGYVSVSALWNRHDMLKKLITKGTVSFVASVNGKEISVTSKEKNPLQAIANMKERVQQGNKGTIQRPMSNVAHALAKIIGPPTCKANTAGNPFRGRSAADKGFGMQHRAQFDKDVKRGH